MSMPSTLGGRGGIHWTTTAITELGITSSFDEATEEKLLDDQQVTLI